MKINYTTSNIALKTTFTSIRSSLSSKEFGFVQIYNSGYFGIGELSPIHSFGENITNCSDQVNDIIELTLQLSIDHFHQWLTDHEKKYFPSVIHAFESAILDLSSKKENIPLFEYLNLPSPNGKNSCITVPINYSLKQINDLLKQFSNVIIKIKLSGNIPDDVRRIEEVIRLRNQKIWIDAECVFTSVEQCTAFISTIDKERILILEDPLCFEPNEQWNLLKEHSEIYVDRFFLNPYSLDRYVQFVDGFNVKPVRFGGLRKSIEVINRIKEKRKKIILGCLLETGVNACNSFALAGLVDYIDLDGYTFFDCVPYNGIVWDAKGMNYIHNIGNGIM